jgi:hypothetical protein
MLLSKERLGEISLESHPQHYYTIINKVGNDYEVDVYQFIPHFINTFKENDTIYQNEFNFFMQPFDRYTKQTITTHLLAVFLAKLIARHV